MKAALRGGFLFGGIYAVECGAFFDSEGTSPTCYGHLLRRSFMRSPGENSDAPFPLFMPVVPLSCMPSPGLNSDAPLLLPGASPHRGCAFEMALGSESDITL